MKDTSKLLEDSIGLLKQSLICLNEVPRLLVGDLDSYKLATKIEQLILEYNHERKCK